MAKEADPLKTLMETIEKSLERDLSKEEWKKFKKRKKRKCKTVSPAESKKLDEHLKKNLQDEAIKYIIKNVSPKGIDFLEFLSHLREQLKKEGRAECNKIVFSKEQFIQYFEGRDSKKYSMKQSFKEMKILVKELDKWIEIENKDTGSCIGGALVAFVSYGCDADVDADVYIGLYHNIWEWQDFWEEFRFKVTLTKLDSPEFQLEIQEVVNKVNKEYGK